MDRATVFCIVEGQTENAVLKHLVVPYLATRGVDLHAPIVRVGQGRGGTRLLRADTLYDQIRRFLKDPRRPWVTTLFDYYAFPTGKEKGWEFVSDLKSKTQAQGAALVADQLEEQIRIRALASVDLTDADTRLIPYIQLHEVEALYFAEPQINGGDLRQPLPRQSVRGDRAHLRRLRIDRR